MTNPIIKLVNAETGQEIEREMTADEFAQYQVEQAEQAAKDAELVAKESARQAILDRLGLTADEAALLLGAN